MKRNSVLWNAISVQWFSVLVCTLSQVQGFSVFGGGVAIVGGGGSFKTGGDLHV